MDTLTITNFAGRLTRYNDGDINSGFAKYSTSHGYDPFTNPGNLSWYETPIQIDAAGSVITDLIMCGKERVESGILYVYCVGHTGRVYKIQVNNPSTYNPNYDNPVLLTTITLGTPTFTRGGFIDFYGATERMYIGHDKGVTRLDFDGTNETVVGVAGSYTQTVPRPLQQFVGKLYFGNGNNVGEIDTTGTVTTYNKLSPGFPSNTQVRDMDTSVDGIYLESVVSRLALGDLTSTTPDSTSTANSESYIFKWNGADTGYTSFVTYPSFSLTANTVSADRKFVFGYDIAGACVFNPTSKIITPILTQSPLPNTVSINANLVGWSSSEFVNGALKASEFLYGNLDAEYPESWYRIFQMSSSSPETDVQRIPFSMIVSDLNFNTVTSGYVSGVVGVGKTYFSTLETSPAPTTKYKFYKFINTVSGAGTAIPGVYETQTQLMSKKQRISEVRVYCEPLVANNSFTVELIGSDGGVISGSSKTFTAGTAPVTVGQDYVWYSPQCAPTYAIGLRITNVGSANMVITKAEIDYEQAGK